jgi:hypothetical protein
LVRGGSGGPPIRYHITPLVFWAYIRGAGLNGRAALQCATPFVAFGLLIACSFEIWTVAVFGLNAKLTNNPTVYYRQSDTTLGQTTGNVLLGTFVPDVRHWPDIWKSASIPKTAAGLGTRMYFTLSNWVTASAGTFFLASLPYLPLARRTILEVRARYKREHGSFLSLLVIVVAIAAIHALLTPYSAPHGSMSVGLAPLFMMAVYFWLSIFGRFGHTSGAAIHFHCHRMLIYNSVVRAEPSNHSSIAVQSWIPIALG